MRGFAANVPSVALILFELIVGVLLFRDPAGFTNTIVVLFGVFMLALGAQDLLRAWRFRTAFGLDCVYLAGAVADLIIGLFCVFGSALILGVFPALVMICGAFLAVTGFYKVRNYLSLRRMGFTPHWLVPVSALAAVALGAVLVLHPFATTETLWSFAGCVLIVEAVMDLLTLILGRRA